MKSPSAAVSAIFASATGTITGRPVLDSATADAGWLIGLRNGAVVLKHLQPFVMIVR